MVVIVGFFCFEPPALSFIASNLLPQAKRSSTSDRLHFEPLSVFSLELFFAL
jgi:hypothetical protein